MVGVEVVEMFTIYRQGNPGPRMAVVPGDGGENTGHDIRISTQYHTIFAKFPKVIEFQRNLISESNILAIRLWWTGTEDGYGLYPATIFSSGTVPHACVPPEDLMRERDSLAWDTGTRSTPGSVHVPRWVHCDRTSSATPGQCSVNRSPVRGRECG